MDLDETSPLGIHGLVKLPHSEVPNCASEEEVPIVLSPKTIPIAIDGTKIEIPDGMNVIGIAVDEDDQDHAPGVLFVTGVPVEIGVLFERRGAQSVMTAVP